jgi:hypothetical protein
MRILPLVLYLAACADDPACPDPDPPHGGRVQCHMMQFLAVEGLREDAIVDVTAVDLVDLASPAWTQTESARFELGTPALYATGQRIIFDTDGAIHLSTFARPDHAAFVQTITRAADGAVSNPGAVRIPL